MSIGCDFDSYGLCSLCLPWGFCLQQKEKIMSTEETKPLPSHQQLRHLSREMEKLELMQNWLSDSKTKDTDPSSLPNVGINLFWSWNREHEGYSEIQRAVADIVRDSFADLIDRAIEEQVLLVEKMTDEVLGRKS